MNWRKGLLFFFELAFLFFIVSFFLTLGFDTSYQNHFRMVYGAILIVTFLCFLAKLSRDYSFKSLTGICFLLFLIFELARCFMAAWQIKFGNPTDEQALLFYYHLTAPLTWSVYFGVFALGFFLFRTRERALRLLWVLVWCGFILAMNVLPPLLTKGHPGYAGPDGQSGFFYPLFYFHPLVSKYLMSRAGHVNYTGDVVALGFFPALSLFLYALHRLGGTPKSSFIVEASHEISFASLGIPATFAIASALAAILFFSRGTIMAFAASLVLYLLATVLKFPSRFQLGATGMALLLLVGFFFWAGKPEAIWKELQTVEGETDTTKETSFGTNREGAQRALALYKAHPFWGAGTEGYAEFSIRFATRGTEKNLMARVRAMCHYLQLLAEEGVGAFVYFLFVIAYFLEVGWGLLWTKSRFQFLAGLSLVMGVAMVLAHAAINHLMQQFSIASLVYILMGASLGILKKDFEHA